MSRVWEIEDIRSLIFSFLRKKPYKSCNQCNCCLQWDYWSNCQCHVIDISRGIYEYTCSSCLFTNNYEYQTILE